MIDPKLLVFLRGRVTKCPLCKWILEDLELHGGFTKDYPKNQNLSSPIFPIDVKPKHLVLEGVVLVNGLEETRLPDGWAPEKGAPQAAPDAPVFW